LCRSHEVDVVETGGPQEGELAVSDPG